MAIAQSASVLILSNWTEVRKLFISYLYTSSTSPYDPADAIFSRDDYQSDVGNLPHMHMLISMYNLNMSDEQVEKLMSWLEHLWLILYSPMRSTN